MIGQTISRYRIVEKLGEGGMGVVYKAEDTRLHRTVVLKFLSDKATGSSEHRARFLKEAEAAAALDHPNITTVYDVGEEEGRAFIAMAFVDGITLAEAIARRPLPLEKALDITADAAEALQLAHEKGVVHRDIKPGNIMVTPRGETRVLDFGLAHLAGQTRITRAGTIMGTPAYMSPEQAQGNEVDRRTDVWSLGVVLYEMVTGQLPFRGEKDQSVIYSIINEEPEPTTALRSGLPIQLDRILSKALAKRAAERYQHVDDLLADLRILQRKGASTRTTRLGPAVGRPVAGGSSEVPRVAVLPLKTRGGDSELEALAEELTEDITAGLSQFRHLVVVSSRAAAAFQGPIDLRRVGTELGGRFLFDGSIRKAGSSLRVSIKLVDSETGAHLWAERFDRELEGSNIFAVQDELTDRIVATVADSSGVLTRALATLTKSKPAESLTADECVLRTFLYWQNVRPDEHAELRTMLERVVKQEPNNAEAWACLSWIYLDEARFMFNMLPNPMDRCLAAALHAVQLDATSQLAYRSLSEAHYYRREYSAFRPAADRVLALNPRDTSNVAMVGQLIAYGGDWEVGRAVVEKAREMNPHHAPWLYFVSAHDDCRRGDYKKALESAEKINMPGYAWASGLRALIYSELGQVEESRKHLKMCLDIEPNFQLYAPVIVSTWMAEPDVVGYFMVGLRKAGLVAEGDK